LAETADKGYFGFSDDDLRTQQTSFATDLFKGTTVIVSGAGSGLGKAIATLFARLGANLAICGRNPEKLNTAANFFREFGGKVFAMPISIRDPDQVEEFFEAIQLEFGGFDVLINNAGGQFPQPAVDFSRNGWNAVIDTNLNGTWWMMQTAARHWIKNSAQGAVVNIVADIWRGMPGIAHTCAARAGVVYLSKTVAIEWAPHGLRVNCVAPGCCETTGYKQYPPEGLATYTEGNPMLRSGDEWDIAEAVIYLAAPTGKFITGEVLTVDGGQQLWGDPWPTGRPEYFQSKNGAVQQSPNAATNSGE